jgi:hypothetical protein
MSEGEGPSAGGILLGIFMLLAGLCITLLGSGCTLMWMSELNSPYSGGLAMLVNPLFIISLVTLAGGVGMLWVGFKLLTGKYRS